MPAGLNGHGGVNIVPPAIDPLSPKNMALSPDDAVLRLRPVRDRRRPAADLPGLALRPLEGPDGRDRRLPDGHQGDPRRPARAGRLDGDRRPRGLGVLPAHLRVRRTTTPTSRSSTTSTTSARSRSTPSSRSPTCCIQKSIREGFGLTVDRGAVEGPADDRRRRRRHPAADRGRRERLPGLLARGGGRALASRSSRDPELGKQPGPRRQGARPRALPHPAPAARLAADLQRRSTSLRAAATRWRLAYGVMAEPSPLTIVSNRGPAEFELRRGRRADRHAAAAAAW